MALTSMRIVAAVFASLFAISALADAPQCKAVHGTQVETLVTGPGCTSAIGLCTTAELSGTLKAVADFSASAIIPSADTPTTSVVFVTGDSVLRDVHLAGARGTLTVKNAAAFRTTGNGDLADVQTIVGGTGDFAGATGSLRVSGFFLASSGEADYEGTVCVP